MFAPLVVLAASAAVLVSAQLRPPVVTGPGCTANSFAIPSWYILDLQYSGAVASEANGNVSFHILNRATNYTADLACEVGGSDWTPCSIQGEPPSNDTIHASIQVNGTLAQVLVNQTWACGDRNDTRNLDFKVVGNNSVALNCTGSETEQGQACKAVDSPLLVKGTLLSPVALTPTYADGPTGHDAPGCVAAAQNPSWVLSRIYYVDQTGDGNESVPSRSFLTQIINPTIGYQASCMSGAVIDDPTLVCNGGEFGRLGSDRYQLATSAKFEPATSTFTVNQTWYCDDVDPGKPLKITATGSEVLSLNCTTKPLKDEPAWNVTTCDGPTDVTVNGTLISADPLTPYSIEDPLPTADDCTISSIFSPKWTFSDFKLNRDASPTAANDSSSSSISFDIILQTKNTGFQYPVSITPDTQVGNSSWYNCAIGGGGDTGQLLWPSDCTIQYKAATKEIMLKADWICSDLDPDHPVLFSGESTTTLDSPLTCATAEGMSQCETTDAAFSWSVDISDVTWRPATQE